jgi:hypothetical protein
LDARGSVTGCKPAYLDFGKFYWINQKLGRIQVAYAKGRRYWQERELGERTPAIDVPGAQAGFIAIGS